LCNLYSLTKGQQAIRELAGAMSDLGFLTTEPNKEVGAIPPKATPVILTKGRAPESLAEPVRQRKIIHIDMDAFYASVEQRDNPELRGKPVAVGGSRERGVVAAASYEARKFGVRSAMPSVTAKRQCPDLIFVKPRFDAYKAVSLQIREIFAEHTPLIEPLSLDEAYLDVTENLQGIATATEIAEKIRAKIRAETNLTASAGVSYNKFLAKLASDHRKPDGLFVITPKMGPAFVEVLPVGKFHGVGPATTTKMNRLDDRPVRADRIRKSIGAENTFSVDLFTFEAARDALLPIIDRVWRHCGTSGNRGRTVTLKIKYADFQQITRSRSLAGIIEERTALERISLDLLKAQFPVAKGIRLLGISLSTFAPTDPSDQLPLGI
jgi:DNA polymerase IV